MTDSAMERAKETPDPPATTRTDEKREETKAAWPYGPSSDMGTGNNNRSRGQLL